MPNESRQAFGVERVPLHDSLNKSPEEDDDLVCLLYTSDAADE